MIRCPYCNINYQDTGCRCYNPQCPGNLPIITHSDTYIDNDSRYYGPNEINKMIDDILEILEEYKEYEEIEYESRTIYTYWPQYLNWIGFGKILEKRKPRSYSLNMIEDDDRDFYSFEMFLGGEDWELKVLAKTPWDALIISYLQSLEIKI